jgi:hypothetical protein
VLAAVAAALCIWAWPRIDAFVGVAAAQSTLWLTTASRWISRGDSLSAAFAQPSVSQALVLAWVPLLFLGSWALYRWGEGLIAPHTAQFRAR